MQVSDTVGAVADQIFMVKADFTSATATGVKRLGFWWDGTTANFVTIIRNNGLLEVIVQAASVEVYRASATDTGNVTIVLRRVGGTIVAAM